MLSVTERMLSVTDHMLSVNDRLPGLPANSCWPPAKRSQLSTASRHRWRTVLWLQEEK